MIIELTVQHSIVRPRFITG